VRRDGGHGAATVIAKLQVLILPNANVLSAASSALRLMWNSRQEMVDAA
jgi:hypothetical protein